MALIQVETTREIAAPAEKVYAAIADFASRAQWLPENFSDYAVEGDGRPGSVLRYRLKVGPRERQYRMQTTATAPGSAIREQDSTSSLQSTWTVTPSGNTSNVRIATQWQGSGGMGGFFERLFAPAGLKKVYDAELTRLDAYIAGGAPPAV